MRIFFKCTPSYVRRFHSSLTSKDASKQLIHIENATFYRKHPSSSPSQEEASINPPLFLNLDFSLSAENEANQHWAIIGPSNAGKTTFLELLQGQHICLPPRARSFPYLLSDEIKNKGRGLTYAPKAIHYVGFGGRGKGLSGLGTHMSARYESRREVSDFSLLEYLIGKTQLNAATTDDDSIAKAFLDEVIRKLDLEDLLDMPAANLSNGQTRRARLAKALLGRPELLLIDEPFMGLDPPTTIRLSPLLRGLAEKSSPRIFLALRAQDPIPDWITHLIYLGESLRVTHTGTVQGVNELLQKDLRKVIHEDHGEGLKSPPRFNVEFGRILTDFSILPNPLKLSVTRQATFHRALRRFKMGHRSPKILKKLGIGGNSLLPTGEVWRMDRRLGEGPPIGDPVVEMSGVEVKYGDKAVIGDWDEQLELRIPKDSEPLLVGYRATHKRQHGLYWKVHRGQRWAIIGPNGSGKTTLLSLITADHPQAYAAPMKVFGRARLPTPGEPGISIFDIQRRIGHCSPEVHSFFPRHLTVRRSIESAYADTPSSQPYLDYEIDSRINAALRWFQNELNPAMGMDPQLRSEIMHRERMSEVHDQGIKESVEKSKHASERSKDKLLQWADHATFGELTLSSQRVLLFLRAVIAQPDIVILDEAFSGLDEETRDKCILFLEHGEFRRPLLYDPSSLSIRQHSLGDVERDILVKTGEKPIIHGLKPDQALIVVNHVQQEIPRSTRNFLYLPEAGIGAPCAYGSVRNKPLKADYDRWHAIWNIPNLPRKIVDDPSEVEEEPLKPERRPSGGKVTKPVGRPRGHRLTYLKPGARRRTKYTTGTRRRDTADQGRG